MEFDELKAIESIRKRLGDERCSCYDDDQLLNVIDIIWDFYEENGLLDLDWDEDFIDEEDNVMDDLIQYTRRMLEKDKLSTIRKEDIEDIIKAEIEYENSLDEI